jgi:NAD(P)-dependent dehydrogenase (short-subunit alcohol dehydrogenase family)
MPWSCEVLSIGPSATDVLHIQVPVTCGICRRSKLMTMSILEHNLRGGVAVVVGGTGGIGAAIVARLLAGGVFQNVVAFSRSGIPPLDITSEGSIRSAVNDLGDAEIRLVIDATGFLHGHGFLPEKTFRDLSAEHMAYSFAVNAIGPALLMKYFLQRLPRVGRSVFATLSAKVGSIGDNQVGGWYSYRAGKAALNQLVHTAAIELRRVRPDAICVAIHPGTVATGLSAPFSKAGLNVRGATEAADDLLRVIAALEPAQSGGFFDHQGIAIAW